MSSTQQGLTAGLLPGSRGALWAGTALLVGMGAVAGWGWYRRRQVLARRARHLDTLSRPMGQMLVACFDCFARLDDVPQVYDRERSYYLAARLGDEIEKGAALPGDRAEIDGFWRMVEQLEQHALREAERSLRLILNDLEKLQRRVGRLPSIFGRAVEGAAGDVLAELVRVETQMVWLRNRFFPSTEPEMRLIPVVESFAGCDLPALSSAFERLRLRLGLRPARDEAALLLREREARLPRDYQMRIVQRLENWRAAPPRGGRTPVQTGQSDGA